MAEEADERSRSETPQSSEAEGSLGRSVASGLLSAVVGPWLLLEDMQTEELYDYLRKNVDDYDPFDLEPATHPEKREAFSNLASEEELERAIRRQESPSGPLSPEQYNIDRPSPAADAANRAELGRRSYLEEIERDVAKRRSRFAEIREKLDYMAEAGIHDEPVPSAFNLERVYSPVSDAIKTGDLDAVNAALSRAVRQERAIGEALEDYLDRNALDPNASLSFRFPGERYNRPYDQQMSSIYDLKYGYASGEVPYFTDTSIGRDPLTRVGYAGDEQAKEAGHLAERYRDEPDVGRAGFDRIREEMAYQPSYTDEEAAEGIRDLIERLEEEEYYSNLPEEYDDRYPLTISVEEQEARDRLRLQRAKDARSRMRSVGRALGAAARGLGTAAGVAGTAFEAGRFAGEVGRHGPVKGPKRYLLETAGDLGGAFQIPEALAENNPYLDPVTRKTAEVLGAGGRALQRGARELRGDRREMRGVGLDPNVQGLDDSELSRQLDRELGLMVSELTTPRKTRAVFEPVEEEDDRLLRDQVSLNPSGE